MNNLAIYALGFAGQAFFGARLMTQWWISERKGRVVSPAIYWQCSLLGAATFFLYGLFRSDPVIIVGQLLSYYIYIRNLQLKKSWDHFPAILKTVTYLAPGIVCSLYFFSPGSQFSPAAYLSVSPVMVLGAIGQLALNLRFVYQWYYSEKLSDSVLPAGFWTISVWASVLVIFYAIYHPVHSFDPVLFVSQSLGIIVYVRNLMLAKKKGGSDNA